jgi:hypothetical protein
MSTIHRDGGLSNIHFVQGSGKKEIEITRADGKIHTVSLKTLKNDTEVLNLSRTEKVSLREFLQ